MKNPRRILIACESSGVVREAYQAIGWDAWSCDILPTEQPGQHYQCDVREVLGLGWDMMVCHPPCRYLSSSGLWRNKYNPGRAEETAKGLEFVRLLLNAPIDHIALENPTGRIGTAIRPYNQRIQPHEFGHDASKGTCLWLKNLPLLTPTKHVAPRIVDGKKRWANQTDSGQNRLTPSADRWKLRSRTYDGIAKAMAEQWGDLILSGVVHR